MTVLGSVFLGDAHQHRVFSTTPPTSPPPITNTSPTRSFRGQETGRAAEREMESSLQSKPEIESSLPVEVSPEMSLELRLRWLEALLLGIRQDGIKEKRQQMMKENPEKREELFRRAEDVQRKLETIVSSNDGLKRFMEHYDKHAQFLTPAFALSGLINPPSTPSTYASMSSTELDALLSDMESDIRAAERDLREIDMLEKRGVTGAGKLVDLEALEPRLRALVAAHEDDLAKAASLEVRIGTLLEKHATKVDALSELFVAWNDVITDAEDRVDKAERDKEEHRRLGLV